MKQLLTLTLVAMIGFATMGCNKTEKVNASATATQCNGVTCDPAKCTPADCAKTLANCPLQGTPACPLAAAKAANAKPAAVGATKSCSSSKAKAKPAAAGDAKNCCANKARAKDGNGCPFSGRK